MLNRYKVISALALLLLVVALPLYARSEPERMGRAQTQLRQQFVSDGTVIYVENCALCHGAAGEGIGAVPALDNAALRSADYDTLFKTIARGRYGTTMTGWHINEGGVLNDYQVDELIALIRYVDWSQIRELAAAQGLIPPALPVPEVEEAFLDEVARLDPEGAIWAEGMRLYAANCTVCHGIDGQGSDLGAVLNSAELRTKESEELERIIGAGVPGTAMTGWKNALGDAEIASLVAFLKNWDLISKEGLALTPPEPFHIDLGNPQEVLALGEQLYASTCSACHGEDGGGGTGPALNSLQVLTRNSDDQIKNTIVTGGRRPNSSMPAFADRLTSVEIDALVDFLRTWEASATWVENPRGTEQVGGPPWLRATPDPANPVGPSQGRGKGRGNRSSGPPWRQNPVTTP